MKLDDISISLGAASWDMGMMKYLSRTNGLNLIEHSTLKNMPPKVGHKTPTVGGISLLRFSLSMLKLFVHHLLRVPVP